MEFNEPKKVLYKIQFCKRFFKDIDNVDNVFSDKWNCLDYQETKYKITGSLYELNSKEERIIKRFEPEKYNDFIKLFYVLILKK